MSPPPGPAVTRTVAVGPWRLEAADYNASGKTPTLVFLHEGLGSVSLWRDFPGQLSAATGLRAFAYSRRGYGRSSAYPPPWPVRYMHDEAALLPDLLAAARIGEHVLVGHSDGASISLLYAAGARTEGLRGLILEAPHVFAEEAGLRSIEQARVSYAQSNDLRQRLARHHRDPDNAFYGWNTGWLNPAFRSWNIEAALPAVRVPALVIQGEADEYGTLAHVESIRARSGAPVETLLLPACGHSPHKDKPAEALEGMRAFLARLLAGDAEART